MSKTPKIYDKVNWKKDYRKHSDDYIIGKGSFGVLKYKPYKDEIIPYWYYGNIKSATKSSKKIYKLFKLYLKNNDFPGADIARKYLRMGTKQAQRQRSNNEEKHQIYKIFKKVWKKAAKNKKYLKMMQDHVKKQNKK